MVDNLIYHTNYGVIKGFPAPRNSVTKHVKKNHIFSRVFVIANQQLTAANTEKSVSLTDSDVKTFLEGKENQYPKRKTEMYVLSGFNNSISRG